MGPTLKLYVLLEKQHLFLSLQILFLPMWTLLFLQHLWPFEQFQFLFVVLLVVFQDLVDLFPNNQDQKLLDDSF
jgi:hypothetical protein